MKVHGSGSPLIWTRGIEECSPFYERTQSIHSNRKRAKSPM
uniref:Uncharacterized protein n=1 Tax=Anguilla anguilla TaxID=7936 RepID=A0A0E9URC2_ANGAN